MSVSGWLALSCDREGVIVSILRDDYGVARAAGPRAKLSEIVDPGSADKARKLVATVLERGGIAGWTINVPSGDSARPLYFAAVASAESLLILAADDAPQPEGMKSAISRDNRLYEELSRLNSELINRERELARKTAALERLSAEKTRMTAIAAHDLRNPLTVISSYAALLRDTALNEESALYVEEIERSARFMAELVEEMLDVAQLESGRVELHRQDLDLVDAARHAATVNRVRAEAKQIAIVFEQRSDHAIIEADPVKLRQIVNNLVVNAIKFSPAGTAVTIRVYGLGDRAIVEVEDRGIGISPDKLATIFEPFHTIGPAGTAGEKSTGLGLSIVKQLAHLHRATVHVDSEPAVGSTFRVSFPLKR